MKEVVPVALMVVFSFAFTACNRTACRRICECSDDLGLGVEYGDEEDCIENCMDDMRGEDVDCRKSMRSFARCLDRNDCSLADCLDEGEDFVDDCSD